MADELTGWELVLDVVRGRHKQAVESSALRRRQLRCYLAVAAVYAEDGQPHPLDCTGQGRKHHEEVAAHATADAERWAEALRLVEEAALTDAALTVAYSKDQGAGS